MPAAASATSLAEKFERRLKVQRDSGEAPDPRAAQIERLKAENAELRTRITAKDEAVAKLKAFRIQAVSQLTAQHEVITRLRSQVAEAGNVRRMPNTGSRTAPFGSCS
ncbi:hypothetical protein CG723_23765 [Streptomyces sp. CB01635]|uniref:hypothetical protein n=1 Tax=unclassified Streptomyces TaxID=2593676 RepID=UPI000CC48184|nr:hypothetical protein [Streptomyces sp. CB01635]PJN09352.1 hypothetical protein CG723_23765 [Streptomyces sp. CB01635]